MAYSEGRVVHDADSHLMETSDWLIEYADPDIRESLRPINLGGAGEHGKELLAMADEAAAAVVGVAQDKIEQGLMERKGWLAYGSSDGAERSKALDLLGFDRQLVFSTFATTQFEGRDLDLFYGGSTAHNRGMAEFCADDERLLGVGFVPLHDPERASKLVGEAIEMGLPAIMFPSHPPRTHSPTHPDLDPVWAQLAEAGVPAMLHVGGGGKPLRPSFHENGRAKPTDLLGGGESFRCKDLMVLHNPPEIFLAAMALDGVFMRHPKLRFGCIEQGAMWVVTMLRRIDMAAKMFSKTEPLLSELDELPSSYIRRQVRFTPFPEEPVDWIIEQAGDDLFMFSSDYPHPEGGKDPLGKFQASLASVDDAVNDKFYRANFEDMFKG
ncbi:MAG: amidohydrolase family protein [Acidimicrobiales bacterium]